MRIRTGALLAAALALGGGSPSRSAPSLEVAPAGAPEAAPPPAVAPETPSLEEIGSWVASLGSDRFEERQEAAKRLRKAGAAAKAALQGAAEDSKDLEARSRAKEILEQIEADVAAGGRRYRLGVSMEAVEVDGRLVVRVLEVFPGSPAEKAGVGVGDIVVRFAGRAIEVPNDLAAAVREAKTGEEVEMEIMRDGKRETIRLKLGEETVLPPEPPKEEIHERIQVIEVIEE